jgi:hypothetical protein
MTGSLKGTETLDSASRDQFVLMDEAAQDVWGSETLIKCLTFGFATPRPRRASTS